MELKYMPDIVYLKTQDECNGVFEGTKDNGFKYLRSSPVREAAPDLLEALKIVAANPFMMGLLRDTPHRNAINSAIAKAEGKTQ